MHNGSNEPNKIELVKLSSKQSPQEGKHNLLSGNPIQGEKPRSEIKNY